MGHPERSALMPIRPLADAQRDLEQYRDAIVDCVLKAHDAYLKMPGLHRFSLGCKADMLSCLIRHHLCGWVDGEFGVNVIRRRNLEAFSLGNNWVMRVKKMDDLFHVGVSPTYSSDQYDHNEVPAYMAATLLDEERATLLYLGWQVMDNAPDRPQICLICNNGQAEVHWVWALAGTEPMPGLALPVPELPIAPKFAVHVRIKADAPKKRSSE
jgi:hypothetical protein